MLFLQISQDIFALVGILVVASATGLLAHIGSALLFHCYELFGYFNLYGFQHLPLAC